MVRSIVLRVFDPTLELKELNSIVYLKLFNYQNQLLELQWKIHHSIRTNYRISPFCPYGIFVELIIKRIVQRTSF